MRKIFARMKTYPLILICLIFHLTVYSQSTPAEEKTLNFGLRVGLAHSNVVGSKIYTTYPSGSVWALDKAERLASYTGGIWGSCKVSPELTLVAEVNVTQKGQRNSFGGINQERKFEMTVTPKFTYLAVPIVLQYNIKNLRQLGFYGGFEMAWLLSAKQVVTGNYDYGTTDIISDFAKQDLGIVIGANYVLVKGIMVDARIVNGIKDISLPSENTFVKNKSFQLGVKLYLPK